MNFDFRFGEVWLLAHAFRRRRKCLGVQFDGEIANVLIGGIAMSGSALFGSWLTPFDAGGISLSLSFRKLLVPDREDRNFRLSEIMTLSPAFLRWRLVRLL